MNIPRCVGCKNIQPFEKYAAQTTAREDFARIDYAQGCLPGRIACSGAIANPVFGDFCDARLEQPTVPEHPEATQAISPASSIQEIPGYDMFANPLPA